MRMTAIRTQTERKRQDRSVRHAEKRRCRAGTLRVHGPIHPTSGAGAIADAAWGENACSTGKIRRSWRQTAGHLGNVGLMSFMRSPYKKKARRPFFSQRVFQFLTWGKPYRHISQRVFQFLTWGKPF